MNLSELGWKPFFQIDPLPEGCALARVAEMSNGLYRLFTESGELLSHIAGKIRFRAEERDDFPVVGDWVVIRAKTNEGRATIVRILPRQTSFSRKSAGRVAERQILCANMDTIFVVSSMDQDFNIRRLERYLASAWESGAKPIVILTKFDLCPEPQIFRDQADAISFGVPVHALSAVTGYGMEIFGEYVRPGMTSVFVGSSGVGKSTLINTLCKSTKQRIATVRPWDHRGRHTTTSRQMILLPSGGIVIDTPGLREFGLLESSGLAETFPDITALAIHCKFRNCAHEAEVGCAVKDAVANGEFDAERLDSYHKLQAEIRFLKTKFDAQEQRKMKASAKRLSKEIKRLYKTRKNRDS